MIDWSSCPAVEQDSERYSGAWLFRGTRVPVAVLFENLEDDVQVQDFLTLFPGVTREQVSAVLTHAAHSAQSIGKLSRIGDLDEPTRIEWPDACMSRAVLDGPAFTFC